MKSRSYNTLCLAIFDCVRMLIGQQYELTSKSKLMKEKQELAPYLRPIDDDNNSSSSSSSSNSNEHGKTLNQSCSVVPCTTTASRRRTTPQIDGGSSVVQRDHGIRVIITIYRCMRRWKRTRRTIRNKRVQQ